MSKLLSEVRGLMSRMIFSYEETQLISWLFLVAAGLIIIALFSIVVSYSHVLTSLSLNIFHHYQIPEVLQYGHGPKTNIYVFSNAISLPISIFSNSIFSNSVLWNSILSILFNFIMKFNVHVSCCFNDLSNLIYQISQVYQQIHVFAPNSTFSRTLRF